MSRLVALAQERHLIERLGDVRAAGHVGHAHFQRKQRRHVRPFDAFGQVVELMHVHQETDLPQFHAVHRHVQVAISVQGTQHETIAAQRHDQFGLARRHIAIPLRQCVARLLCDGGVAGDKSKTHRKPWLAREG